MEKITKKILKAKKERNYSKVQKLQQTLSKPFKKINDMNKEYNKKETADINMIVDYIKEGLPYYQIYVFIGA